MLATQRAPCEMAIATFGSETKRESPHWQACCSNIKPMYLCYENDQAGDLGSLKWRDTLGDKVNRVRVPFGKDPSEYAQYGGAVASWITQTIGDSSDQMSAANNRSCEGDYGL